MRLGRYELLGHLATGGMAEIHLARLAGEAGFEKIVVVKRLLPELVASKAFVAMFLEEAKLVSRLDHPNICEVYELGREGADYFIVMPYLDGVPATDFIARPRDPDRIAQLRVATGIILQACTGLHHAHELRDAGGESAGLVHRDVSPSNLFITTSGTVKVLDFGIAKVRGAAETEVGTVKGKAQYMAPEQVLGEEMDRRCDVFALGIVLFELATHQRLFKRSSDYLAARAILEEPIPRADAVDPAVPAALADVIARALGRDRATRFADARELGEALRSSLAAHGGPATPAEIAASLAEWHSAELTAQRTRQAKIVDAARSGAIDRSDLVTRQAPASIPPAGPGAAEPPVTTPVPATKPARPSAIQSVEEPPRRRGLPIALVAIGVLVLAAIPAAILRWPDSRPGVQAADARNPDVRISEIHEPDAQGSDVQHPDGRGSDGRGSDVQHPDGRGSDTRVPDVQVPPPRGSDEGSAHVNVAPHPPRGRGYVSIDSTPYATIYIDDVKLDITPILKRSVSAGRHRIKAVLLDGRTKWFSITVPTGKAAQPIVLTW